MESLAESQANGPAINDDIREAVERVAALAAAQLQRDVKTALSPNTSGTCTRWYAADEHSGLQFGLTETDLVGLVEIVLGAVAARPERESSALERRLLGWQLRQILGPLAAVVGHRFAPSEDLHEWPSRATPSWERFTLRLAVTDVDYEIVVAYRPRVSAAAQRADTAPNVDGIPIELEIGLRSVKISWGELAGLTVDDVIRCDHRADAPIAAWAGDRRVLSGVVTRTGSGLLFEVSDSYLGVR